MKPISASEAVVLAVKRARSLLFRPFEWRGFLTLGAIAVVTEGIALSFRFTVAQERPINIDMGAGRSAFSLSHIPSEMIPLLMLAGLFAILVGITFFYLIARLRFTLFHCVLHHRAEIRQGWSVYRAQAERFCIASLFVWLGLLVLVILLIGVIVGMAFTVFTIRTPDGKFDMGVFFLLFYPCIGIICCVLLTAIAAEVVLHDFILPHMALENATFRTAWAAVRRQIGANRETFFSYFVLRLLLPGVVGVVVAAAAWIPVALLFWILSTSATGFHDMLEDATGAGAAVRIFLAFVFGAFAFAAGAFASICTGGPLAVWVRCYALYFYGGHYAALGDLLMPAELCATTDGANEFAET